MKNDFKSIKILLLATIISTSTFGQNYELNKNVFFNDIDKIYMSKGLPFTGKLITLIDGSASVLDNNFLPKKKIIEFKNGVVDGLITTLSTKGDTLSKFYIKNNKFFGKFFFKYKDGYNLKLLKGSSNNDTLIGKIEMFQFSCRSKKFEILFDGTFSKYGKPIGDFKSYYIGDDICAFYNPKGIRRKVIPFSDHLGFIKVESTFFNNFVSNNDNFYYNKGITDVFSITGLIEPDGIPSVSIVREQGRTDLLRNHKFYGYSINEEDNDKFEKRHKLSLIKEFNGDYREGFDVSNITFGKYKNLMNLLDNNHDEYVMDIDGEDYLYRKSYEKGRLVGDYIDVWNSRGYFYTKIKTFFENGNEVGPRFIYYEDGNDHYNIENIINKKFHGKLFIYHNKEKKYDPIKKSFECNFLNGEIKLPITYFYKDGKKRKEYNKVDNQFLFTEYFIDGSLKVKSFLNENQFNEILKDVSRELISKYGVYYDTF